MFSREPSGRFGGGAATGGLRGPIPPTLWWLLGIVFATFSFQFFEATAFIPALMRLSPDVWQRGFVWQLVTYPFAGFGAPSFWFLLELFILFLFGRDVLSQLGPRRFWRVLIGATSAAALTAVLVELIMRGLGGAMTAVPFSLMQGQRLLIVVLIAAFATLYGEATIYLFFVLPIQARWFLALEILFAFMGFLGSQDLAGFLGICAAVGLVVFLLGQKKLRLQRLRLELRERYLRLRLLWLKRRRGMGIVQDEPRSDDDPWVH